MKKISLFLSTFANNREPFWEKVTKNKFIIGNLTGKGFWYFLCVCFVMGAPVCRNVLNARWIVYVHGNLWKWLLVQKMKEIFKVSYDILLYLEKKTPYIFISKWLMSHGLVNLPLCLIFKFIIRLFTVNSSYA